MAQQSERSGATQRALVSRRQIILGGGLLAFAMSRGWAAESEDSLGSLLSELEAAAGGRLGVHALAAAKGESVSYRATERFGMCSTFKLPLAALVLQAAERGELELEQEIHYGKNDMVAYAPVTEKHLGRGYMTVEALACAAQTTSDNVAANLLIRELGGPAAFTRSLREWGDDITRLDRYEPALNLVPPGEVRDTTSPQAMANTVATFLGQRVLSARSQATLRSWMEATRTGTRRLRAGFPPDAAVGNKTGTGIASSMANKYNDVAAIWDESHGLVVVTAYYEADDHYPSIRPRDEAVLAQVGRTMAGWLQRGI